VAGAGHAGPQPPRGWQWAKPVSTTSIDHSPRDKQAEAFVASWRSVARAQRPFVCHVRDAHADALAILQLGGGSVEVGGVVHCFSGNLEHARGYLDLGLDLSFSGILTFKTADEIRRVAAYAPLRSILVETDAPLSGAHTLSRKAQRTVLCGQDPGGAGRGSRHPLVTSSRSHYGERAKEIPVARRHGFGGRECPGPSAVAPRGTVEIDRDRISRCVIAVAPNRCAKWPSRSSSYKPRPAAGRPDADAAPRLRSNARQEKGTGEGASLRLSLGRLCPLYSSATGRVHDVGGGLADVAGPRHVNGDSRPVRRTWGGGSAVAVGIAAVGVVVD
jgi:hypothetical protein